VELGTVHLSVGGRATDRKYSFYFSIVSGRDNARRIETYIVKRRPLMSLKTYKPIHKQQYKTFDIESIVQQEKYYKRYDSDKTRNYQDEQLKLVSAQRHLENKERSDRLIVREKEGHTITSGETSEVFWELLLSRTNFDRSASCEARGDLKKKRPSSEPETREQQNGSLLLTRKKRPEPFEARTKERKQPVTSCFG
jgi:hypothetical protein